jgi:hypothetical protein
MKIRLTLIIEKDVVEKVKRYAKNNGKSLSYLVETFLNNISKKDSTLKSSSKLNKIMGAVKLPPNFNEKNERNNYFENKHM